MKRISLPSLSYLVLILFSIIQLTSSFISIPSLSSLSSLSLSSSSSLQEIGNKLILPSTIEEMMQSCAKSIKAAKLDNIKLSLLDIPIPVTGGTELDDWPGGIAQKQNTLRPMLQSMMKTLEFSDIEINQRNYVGEFGVDDSVGIWEDKNISIVCFPTPDSIPLLIKLTKLNDNALVIVNNQFFLDPLSKEESKSFLKSCTEIYKLEQLNMKGENALPVRGILFRSYPNYYIAARRISNGDYIILQYYNEKPDRKILEKLFYEDSKVRDGSLSFADKLKRFIPNFGN